MIETQRLIIREFKLSDANALSNYRDKEEVSYYQSWSHYPLFKAKKRIEYCLKHPLSNQKGNYQLAVELKNNQQLIGDYFIEVINPDAFTLGYTFDSDYWSHGYASESLRALLRFMKTRFNFKTVICYVYKDNDRSIRLLENNGFKKFEESIIMHDCGYKRML